MSGRDDYLWDKYPGERGEPDAELRELEALLAPFAHDGRELRLGDLPAQRPARPRAPRRRPALLLAAAALVVAALAVAFALREGDLRQGSAPRVFVTADAERTIPLGPLVEITLAPGSELRFEHWRADQALCRLERGALRARVAPPPAVQPDFFLVDTALGRVTDKGCRYELRIDLDGQNRVRVTEGMVTFTRGARTIWVPVGAQATISEKGASTPLFEFASRKLREVAARYDQALWLDARDERVADAKDLCVVAREPRDSLALFHLLFDDDQQVRDLAENALVDLVGPPAEIVAKELHWDPAVWLAFLRLGPWMAAK